MISPSAWAADLVCSRLRTLRGSMRGSSDDEVLRVCDGWAGTISHKDKHLLMLWSSYEHLNVDDRQSHYVQTVARSVSGEIEGAVDAA